MASLALYRAIYRRARTLPEALPPDLFVLLVRAQQQSMSQLLQPRYPTQLLRRAFTTGFDGTQKGDDLDLAFAALRYSDARAAALSPPPEPLQGLPAFMLGSPAFTGETIAFHFYEPR